jgi:hypothetical protein
MKAIKKVTLSLLLVVCLLVVVNGSASAMTASGGGFSGLINIPTADILSTNQATIGYQLIDNGDKVLLNYGIENNIEFGLTGYWYDEERNNGDDSDLFLNVKMRFMEENSNQPALAMGIVDEDLYITASKNLDYYDLRGHIGVGNGGFDGVFAGLSKTINPVSITADKGDSFKMPVTTLMLDYVNQSLNVGAKFKINSQFNFNVALEDLSDLSAGVQFNNQF